ncbi:hypothetical protein DENIT_30017 [Pseudomonas veronii]|nr:hypothetical protein DENIT_30017 [Pseudomonas veronii]
MPSHEIELTNVNRLPSAAVPTNRHYVGLNAFSWLASETTYVCPLEPGPGPEERAL